MPRLLRKTTLAKTEESIALRTLKQEKPQKKTKPFKVINAALEKSMIKNKPSKLKTLIREESR